MEAFALTDVGIERKINQDYVYFTLKQTGHLPNLFIVADGMGGHKAGDVASRYTVDEFVSLIENATEKDDITVISEAVTKVNTMLLEKAKESPDYTYIISYKRFDFFISEVSFCFTFINTADLYMNVVETCNTFNYFSVNHILLVTACSTLLTVISCIVS